VALVLSTLLEVQQLLSLRLPLPLQHLPPARMRAAAQMHWPYARQAPLLVLLLLLLLLMLNLEPPPLD
jgi:hypothetical protein